MGNNQIIKKVKNKLKHDDPEKEDASNVQIYYSQINGKKKKEGTTGQDIFDIMTKELGENIKFFAVYDGHGQKGKEAAQGVKSELRKKLLKDKSKISKIIRKEQVEKYFKEAFKSIQKKFANNTEYELSGTCAICILIIEAKLYSINLGDSRAVLGSKKAGKKIALEMSIDHKPTRDDECKRIEKAGGEVTDKLQGVKRVFKKNEEAPGLAVSRSLGDLVGHECGVISEPEVIEKELDQDDAFVVIASDGVWDSMTSTEVVGYIFEKMEQKKEYTATWLVDECRNRWDLLNLYRQKFFQEFLQSKESNTDGSQKSKDERQNMHDVDDITAVIHFINYYE
jgi:serine/threonine protein phosphatase PrpC